MRFKETFEDSGSIFSYSRLHLASLNLLHSSLRRASLASPPCSVIQRDARRQCTTCTSPSVHTHWLGRRAFTRINVAWRVAHCCNATIDYDATRRMHQFNDPCRDSCVGQNAEQSVHQYDSFTIDGCAAACYSFMTHGWAVAGFWFSTFAST